MLEALEKHSQGHRRRVPDDTDPEAEDTPAQSTLKATVLRQDLMSLGPDLFIKKYLYDDLYSARELLGVFGINLPDAFDEAPDASLISVLEILLNRDYNKRQKLAHIKTIDDIVKVLQQSKQILVVTGAGISTSLGIPDFRSSDGIYSTLGKYNLSDPQELFDIWLFRQDPSIFYDFAKRLLPEARGYSPTHAFIRLLQDRGILLRQYTQNIDDIESAAGILADKLIQCHGSFKTASCLTCKGSVPGHTIFRDIRNGTVPKCTLCNETRIKSQTSSSSKAHKPLKRGREWETSETEIEDTPGIGIMKPDITFFGEQLATDFKTQVLEDRLKADLLICIGTSLRVAPVAGIPALMPRDVPQLFISRESAGKEYAFDLELLGACDETVQSLAEKAGWETGFQAIVDRGRIRNV